MKNKDMFILFPDIQRIMPTFHKIKIEKGMKESSSQTNRVCLGRRFYKRKQEDMKNEIKE